MAELKRDYSEHSVILCGFPHIYVAALLIRNLRAFPFSFKGVINQKTLSVARKYVYSRSEKITADIPPKYIQQ